MSKDPEAGQHRPGTAHNVSAHFSLQLGKEWIKQTILKQLREDAARAEDHPLLQKLAGVTTSHITVEVTSAGAWAISWSVGA